MSNLNTSKNLFNIPDTNSLLKKKKQNLNNESDFFNDYNKPKKKLKRLRKN